MPSEKPSGSSREKKIQKKSAKKSASKAASTSAGAPVRTAKKSRIAAVSGSAVSKIAKKSLTGSGLKTTKKAAKKTAKKAAKKTVKKTARKTAKKSARPERSSASSGTGSQSLNGRSSGKKAIPDQTVAAVTSEPEFRLPSADPEIRKLAEDLVQFLDDRKLTDIKVMNLEDVNPYFCFFMIATAGSPLQVGTTAREISRRFGQHLTNKKIRPVDVESGWVIHDFVDIVLHVFLSEQRSYYNLEKLWGDAPVIYSAESPRFQWPHRDKKTAE